MLSHDLNDDRYDDNYATVYVQEGIRLCPNHARDLGRNALFNDYS